MGKPADVLGAEVRHDTDNVEGVADTASKWPHEKAKVLDVVDAVTGVRISAKNVVVRICAWCAGGKHVTWLVGRLGFKVSHGICDGCMKRQLEDRGFKEEEK